MQVNMPPEPWRTGILLLLLFGVLAILQVKDPRKILEAVLAEGGKRR